MRLLEKQVVELTNRVAALESIAAAIKKVWSRTLPTTSGGVRRHDTVGRGVRSVNSPRFARQQPGDSKAAPDYNALGQNSQRELREFTETLRGFGRYETHIDHRWLYLPTGFCQGLGSKRKQDWYACPISKKRLLAFRGALWDPFWEAVRDDLQLDPSEVARLQHDTKRIQYRAQKSKGERKQYTREYWLINKEVMKNLNFSGKDHQLTPSQMSLKCQISPAKFYFDITPLEAPDSPSSIAPGG
jgi:hypothetical protein